MVKGKYPILVGSSYGRLTILKNLGIVGKETKVLAECNCGVIKEMIWSYVARGVVKSCGCLRLEVLSTLHKRVSRITHNLTKHPLYKVWCGIKFRCYNEASENYEYYGGRGIIMCEDWRKDFRVFYEWATPIYKKGLQIDRENNNGNYEPSNCRFVSPKINVSNRSISRNIEFNGVVKTLSDWAVILNLPYNRLLKRIRVWGVERAFTTPLQIKSKKDKL